jgi:hypothetical protein
MFSRGAQAADGGNASGPIKITFHDENSGVVAEANFSTELCGTLENVGRERFR